MDSDTVKLYFQMPVIQMNAIPGFEMVPLLEALNGPFLPSDVSQATATLAIQAARMLSDDKSDTETEKASVPMAMKVMVAPIDPKEESEAEDVKEAEAEGESHEQSESCQTTPVGRHVIKQRLGTSLPSTPNLTAVSTASTRSSGDSFTSSCSTKHLLTQQQQQQV